MLLDSSAYDLNEGLSKSHLVRPHASSDSLSLGDCDSAAFVRKVSARVKNTKLVTAIGFVKLKIETYMKVWLTEASKTKISVKETL